MCHDNKRTYHRYYMRGKAVLKRGDNNCSAPTPKMFPGKASVFFSPVQLLPKERVKLRLPVTELGLEVARCRRLEKGCFECGGRFAL